MGHQICVIGKAIGPLLADRVTISSYLFQTVEPRSTGLKLKHYISHTNKQCHFYFNRICKLWNSLPIINLNLSASTIKNQLKRFFWKHFTENFNSTDSHKLHYLCPRSSCINKFPTNFDYF